MGCELEGRRHTKVASATTKRPEQVRILLCRRGDDPAVGCHQLDREQVVTAQTTPSTEPSHAPTECQSGNARVADEASGDRQTVFGGSGVQCGPRRTPTAAHTSRLDVDGDLIQQTQVEHDRTIGYDMPREPVPAAPHREIHGVPTARAQDIHHLGSRPRLSDHPWTAPDRAVPHRRIKSVLIFLVGLGEHLAGERSRQFRYRADVNRRHDPPPQSDAARTEAGAAMSGHPPDWLTAWWSGPHERGVMPKPRAGQTAAECSSRYSRPGTQSADKMVHLIVEPNATPALRHAPTASTSDPRQGSVLSPTAGVPGAVRRLLYELRLGSEQTPRAADG